MRTQPSAPALLRTKVRPPRLPVHNVTRPRVTALLDEAAGAPFLLVTGPPGAGKTVALQQWVAHGAPATARVAWLSLDAADDAPARFWSYALSALEGSGAGSYTETRNLLAETGRDADDAVVVSLVNETTTHGLAYLVLEDLHHLTDPSLLGQLELLVERAPESLRLVASSRLDPPLPLARWRGAGRLREIRQHQLAFTSSEARELFAQFTGAPPAAEVDLVTERTEGWPVALQLAALQARELPLRSVLDAILRDGAPIAAYLVGEVLDRQPPEVRTFLVETSVLEVLDVRLCDAVTGRNDSRAVLQRLRADNLFVVALPGRQYRYHQLFAEFARLQLRADDPAGEHERALHRRAAEWLEADGDALHAVSHYLQCGDTGAAFELAVAPGMDLWDRDDGHDRARLTLDLFPFEYLEQDPRRIIPYTVALGSSGQWKRIPPLLDLADQRLDPRADPEAQAALDVVRMALHLANGDARRALARPVATVAPAEAGAPGTIRRLRARSDALLARAHLFTDDYHAAHAALAATPLHDPVTDHLVVPALQARLAAWHGELETALALAGGALAAADVMGARHHFAVLDAELAAASVLVDRVDLTAADDRLETTLGLAERRKSLGYQAAVLLLQARVAALRDDPEDALAVLAIARRSLRAVGVDGGLAEHVDAAESRVQLGVGERERARALAAAVGGERGLLLRAELARADGDLERVTALLAGARWSNLGRRLEARLLLAAIEPEEAARRSVEATVEGAAEEGFVRPFLEADPHVRELALHASQRSARPDAWDLATAIRAGVAQGHTTAPVEPLSGREREVLGLLRRPLTNEEIGRELFVSTNTIRTHVRGIYRKLGVNSRAEALARARALHLF